MTLLLILLFIAGYTAIAFEHKLNLNKSAAALLTGVACWSVLILYSTEKETITDELAHHLGEISGILFFLIGAMTIVELIDAHDGFNIITSKIGQRNKRKLLLIISLLTFFLSAILDNLTTTIVMITVLRKLIPDKNDRLRFAGMVIIAANAGGVWSPIGDVTTTMLWTGGQITALRIMMSLIIPAIVCLFTALAFISIPIKGFLHGDTAITSAQSELLSKAHVQIVFYTGIFVLLMVPVFKSVTGLPPYMGMLGGLGVLWVVTSFLHVKKETPLKDALSVTTALERIDTPGILFFLGILLSVSALGSAGILTNTATWLNTVFPNDNSMILSIGLLSSVIDNVPLVAAAQGMFSMHQYPVDSFFWEFMAYCSGTGGSVLIIGSAAGVAAMGMENISFGWYVRRVSIVAIISYFAGAAAYILQENFF